jgi:hypothetical protein
VAAVPSNATGFVHRGALFSIQYGAEWEREVDTNKVLPIIEGMQAALDPYFAPQRVRGCFAAACCYLQGGGCAGSGLGDAAGAWERGAGLSPWQLPVGCLSTVHLLPVATSLPLASSPPKHSFPNILSPTHPLTCSRPT